VYLPVAVNGGALPAALTRAGTQHGTGPHPERVLADTREPGSFWWSFQTLLEAVAGDADGSCYRERQPRVRARLDQLQQRWLAEVEVLAHDGSDEEWQELTRRCVSEAHAVAEELVAELAR
jgi:hypothetical protein